MNHDTQTHHKLDVYTMVTNRIIELLEAGTVPWRKPWNDRGNPPENLITRKPYNGINVWLLISLPYTSRFFLTWKQINALGGKVKQGEHGHIVVFYKWIDVKDREEMESNDTVARKKPLLRYYKVFNIEQCEGYDPALIPLSSPVYSDPIDLCQYYVDNMPNPPKLYHREPRAYYHVAEDYVNMPSWDTFQYQDEYYRTLFHELIHATGHVSRLNRKGVAQWEPFGSETYSMEELVAELGACYLMALSDVGNEHLENSAAYINGWLEKLRNDKRLIIQASGYAQKGVDYILNTNEEKA